jgi:hypothetical protein
MTHTEIVKKLIGSIEPIGKSETDTKRLENLKQMCELVENLIIEIDTVATRHENAYEYSVKDIAEYSRNFLENTLGINKS